MDIQIDQSINIGDEEHEYIIDIQELDLTGVTEDIPF